MKKEKFGKNEEKTTTSSTAFRCSESKANIFLIGDSIRLGYCETVKKELADKAEVFYVSENCRSTQYVIFHLQKWVDMFDDPSRVDLVHFNCGHWDVAHWNRHPLSLTSEAEYARNIGMIVDLLRDAFPNARLMFATTTPMNPNSGSMGCNEPRTSEEIAKYNQIAVNIVAENNIPVNDLNDYVKDWGSDTYKDVCHFTDAAYTVIGKEVARRLDTMI